MLVSQARVATDRAPRYLAQLCRHFGHKVHSEWDDTSGFTDFGWGTCAFTATPGELLLRAEGPDGPSLDRVERVVADHAERFGARDALSVTWTRVGP